MKEITTNLEKRLEEINNKLWCIEMAERLRPCEKREQEELEREKRSIERELKKRQESYLFDLSGVELTEEEYRAESKMLKKMLS